MANFRIINTSHKYPDILLYRDRNENGDELVVIKTFGFVSETEDVSCEETILFNNSESARNFIEDYSETSGDAWCRKEGVII